jgi:hypothetical protein
VNLVTGVGYMSITTIVAMLRRVAEHGKPARIFYISDFDGSGQAMPIAVARQAEFWLPAYAPGADLKITSIALTAEQVARFDLPRAPIAASNQLKDRFEEQHGAGACELDALEELYPGVLEQLVREAAEPYIDPALHEALEDTDSDALAGASAAWEAATADERAILDEIEAEAEAIADRYRSQLALLATQLDADLAPVKTKLETLSQASVAKCDSLEVYLPPRPEPFVDPPSEDAWLFASDREYREQLKHYHARRAPNRPSNKNYVVRDVTCLTCGKPFTARKANAATCSERCRGKLSRSRRKGAA